MDEKTVLEGKPELNAETISEAKEYGWVPKEKFRGDEKDWVDADEYVRRGRNSIPILRRKLSDATGALNSLRTEVGTLRQDMETVRSVGYKQAETEWKARYETLLAQKRQALEDDDASKAVELDERLAAHRETKPVAKTPDTGNNNGNGVLDQNDPQVKSWLAENPWYGGDETLTIRANAIGAGYAQKGVLKNRALLDKVREEMETLFPDEMGVEEAPVQRGHRSSTRTGTGRAANGGGGKSYDDLPPEYRSACDRLVAAKRVTREEYLANVNWESLQ